MVSKDSPKFKMIARGSPKFGSLLAAESVTKKKCSPKSCVVNKGSPREKQKASWNPALEKSLVDILREYKNAGFRGDYGCKNSPEVWTRMVKEFHDRNRYVSFSRTQIQGKEAQLKRDYKMLREARRQSGSSWNYERHMIDMGPAMWDKLIVSFPRIKKFRKHKATFPLYDALREVYNGHLAEGNHNFTSFGSPQEEEALKQTHDVGDEAQDLEDEESEGENERNRQERHDEENEAARAERSQDNERKRQQRGVGPIANKEEKEGKRPRNSANIGGMMERSPEMRTRQTEDEAARLAKEKDSVQASDFSIKRCISVLSTIEVTKEEKAKAYTVFIKNKKNRETFLCACEDDPEAAMIWLKSEMD